MGVTDTFCVFCKENTEGVKEHEHTCMFRTNLSICLLSSNLQ